ncbi:MAG: choice-of-anchor D domain-containing protein [Alphaproteobacteria bacterium]|nr:choice-of-anchor D domain-containing protein [Alphaproteobacteria bacterium]
MITQRNIFALFVMLLLLLQLPRFGMAAPEAYGQVPGLDDPSARSGTGSATGGLVPVVEKIEAGSLALGATAQVVVRFRNDGGQPVQTGVIRLYPSSNVSANVSLNQCESEPLPNGAECAIALSVKALQAGAWRVEMLMTHNGRTRLVTATISGTVESNDEAAKRMTSDLEALPESLDFESLTESQTLTKSITLRNITSNPIEIGEIYIDSSDVSGLTLKTQCKTLTPGQACIATINWSPKMAGRSAGVLVVRHNGPTALTSVPIIGTFTPAATTAAEVFPKAVPGRGLLVSSQDKIEFGDDVSTASTITASLVNIGDAPLTIKDIRIAGSDNGLGFKSGGCARGTVLNPIEACPLTVSWSPTRVGDLRDDVQILHDGARGVMVLPVIGQATATVSPDQKAIVLTDDGSSEGFDLNVPMTPDQIEAALAGKGLPRAPRVVNAAAALDGYKITSFGKDRAIINGPGGSRLVFDQEEVSLGGVPWFVVMKKEGIEFLHNGQRVLLLFDRSLSSLNRVSASSGDASSSTSTSQTTSESTQ